MSDLSPLPADLTERLHRWTQGDESALAEAISIAYQELKAIAVGYMNREKSHHTLQATGLVNELYLRLARMHGAAFQDRRKFYGFAAYVMRIVLIDHARRSASKGGGARALIPLEEDSAWVEAANENVLGLHEALQRLEILDERKVRVLELRYFLGCTNEEVAECLGISRPTVDRDLEFAKAWLYRQLQN